MADARKRARRPGKGGAGRPSASGGETRDEKPAVAPDTATDEGPPAGGTTDLPASGLAEDVLPTVSEPAPTGGEPAGHAARRIELPSSGLASDILSQPEAAAVEPAAAAPAEPAKEALPAEPAAGAQSLSFFAAPAREQREAAEATEHLATFVLDREEYGVDVHQVLEIRRVGEITAVPRAPEFVRGVINLRGRILPVLDLKRKLGLGEVAIQRAARIVVVRSDDRMLGLLVDGASQVLEVPVSRVEPPPEEIVQRGGDYIRGVAKLEDRLIILIDLGRALAHELREAPTATGG
jgi:purine-binding chemotaxis protein CheW